MIAVTLPVGEARKIDVTKDAPGALPCPFCGSADVHNWASEDHGPGTWSMLCFSCECEGPHTDTEQDSIVQWNRRAALPSVELRALSEAAENSNSLLVAILVEKRPESEIENQIIENRKAIERADDLSSEATFDNDKPADVVAALTFYRDEWFLNGDGDTETPGLSRSWMEPTEALLTDEGRKARTVLASIRAMLGGGP